MKRNEIMCTRAYRAKNRRSSKNRQHHVKTVYRIYVVACGRAAYNLVEGSLTVASTIQNFILVFFKKKKLYIYNIMYILYIIMYAHHMYNMHSFFRAVYIFIYWFFI